jgi:hypothetical protein
MGKGKNKGYDLAKRQEKILKRMAKPLYKKPDSSTYFVVTQPFGMHPSPAARGTVDVNRLTSWISWVFRRESVVEAIYTMSTVSREARIHISIRNAFFEVSLRRMKSSSESRKGSIQPGCWGSTNTRAFSTRAGRMTQVPLRACIYTTTRAVGTLPIVRSIPAFSFTDSSVFVFFARRPPP